MPRDDLFDRIQDRMAIVGIGHLPFAKDIGRPIGDTAVEAIQLALDDAGLAAEDVDGMSMFEMEHTHEVSIARRLGVKNLRWWDKISYGGGASCATIMHACAAIATGLASVVVCHRARNRGAKTARPWSQEKGRMLDDKALHVPWGLIRPVDVIGMWAHRHMHEYGTTREHFGNVAIAARKHAQRNPYAMMRDRPLDMETYLNARVIGYPLHMYDCCLETDGALACVVTSIERARDLPRKPAIVHAVAQASGPNPVHLANYNTPNLQTTSVPCAELLWSRSELKPARHGLRADLRRLHAAGDHRPRGLRLLQARRRRPVHRGRSHRARRRAARPHLRRRPLGSLRARLQPDPRRRAPDPRHLDRAGARLQGDAGHRRVGRGDQRDGVARGVMRSACR